MITSATRLILGIVVSFCLLLGSPAYAVVTVPVTDSAGDPVRSQTITLQFSSGRTVQAQTNADGLVQLAEEDEDEEGLLIFIFGDGSRGSYQLGSAGFPWQWAAGIGAVTVGLIAANSNESSSNRNNAPLQEQPPTEDPPPAEDPPTDPPATDPPPTDPPPTDPPPTDPPPAAGGTVTGSCTIDLFQELNNTFSQSFDLLGVSITVEVDRTAQTIVATYAGAITGTTNLTCDVSDDLGLAFCSGGTDELAIDSIPTTQSAGAVDFNEAGDAIIMFGGSFDSTDGTNSVNFTAQGPC